MRNNYLLILFILISKVSNSQSNFNFGLMGSPDFNFYKYSKELFTDDVRSNKVSIGSSFGVFLNYTLNEKFELFTTPIFSTKTYSPDRLFQFGILRSVSKRTIDFPLNVKYTIPKEINYFDQFYVFGGLAYQIELKSKASYDFFDGYNESWNFIGHGHYLIPNIGAGLTRQISNKHQLRLQLNYRLLKCHCEYLNPWIDKFALEIIFLKNGG